MRRHSKHARHARKPTRAELIAQNMRKRARQRRVEEPPAAKMERHRAPVPTPHVPDADGPEVKPVHRGSGRWAAEIDGQALKDMESGDVVLFESRAAAKAAGESFVRATQAEG